MISAKLLIYKSPESRVNSFPQTVDIPSKEEETEEPSPSKSRLSSLEFANESLPHKDAKVAWKMQYFLKAHSYHKTHTNELHKKASRWFPVIEPILKVYGIPSDFKYVPLVESGFASGTSHKGAAGYWQFMPGTARTYGLTVNGSIDERLNIRKSTIAACKYLRALYKEFNNWTLVAAAYNVGENTIKREMYRQKKSSYYKMRLNRETATYVYKLISMKEIIENPTKYGYVSRSKSLLARREDPNLTQEKYINPQVEKAAIEALSVLSN
ncbi:lytic transglycosylase domain-containing protein [Pedobacter sp. SYSU D00535]|uniref:lytic transglycosylase domain-containing protein n=1 Tax=Pedobacter sp. SYSU D00535 TaxID=2810308 RepID=UPI001F625E7C|nr:lytic transglycosylase domain-containing protein [Pedobacter sp. SYSU D00535]